MENNQSIASRVGRNAIYLTAGTVIGYLISFVYRVILARQLGPEEFGVFSLVLTYVGIVATFLSFGYAHSLIKFIPELKVKGKDYNKYIMNCFYPVLVISLLGTLFSILLSGYVANNVFRIPSYNVFFIVGSFSIIFTLFYSFIGSALNGLQRLKESAIGSVLEKVVRFAATILMFYMGFSLGGAVLAVIISSLFIGIYYLHVYLTNENIRKLSDFKKILSYKLDMNIQKQLFSYGFPLFIGAVVYSVVGWVDTFMIGYFLTPTHVGFYSAVLPMMFLMGSVMTSLSLALFPMFSQLNSSSGKVRMSSLLNRSLKYTAYLMIPSAVGVFVLASPLVRVFFTDSYEPSIDVLKILALSSIFYAMNVILNSYINGTGKSNVFMKISLFSSILGFLLNLVLIPAIGINGAAFSALLTLFCITIFSMVYISKTIKLSYRYYFKAIISAGIMFLAIRSANSLSIPLEYKIPIIVVIGFVTYSIAIILVRGFDKSDLTIIKDVIRRRTS